MQRRSRVSPSPADPGDRPAQVVLFGREGCHLCDEARTSLIALLAEGRRVARIEVYNESEGALHRKLLELIPVIEIEGERVSELVPDLDAVRARLAPAS